MQVGITNANGSRRGSDDHHRTLSELGFQVCCSRWKCSFSLTMWFIMYICLDQLFKLPMILVLQIGDFLDVAILWRMTCLCCSNHSLVTKVDMVATGIFHLSLRTARVSVNCMSVFKTIGYHVTLVSLDFLGHTSLKQELHELHIIIVKTVRPENMQCKYMYQGWSHLPRDFDDMLNWFTAFWINHGLYSYVYIYVGMYHSSPSLPFSYPHAS